MAGRPRTRLADRLVADALDLLRSAGPMPPDGLRETLHLLMTTDVEHDAVEMAMRRLLRHADVRLGDGMIAHTTTTNGSGVHAS